MEEVLVASRKAPTDDIAAEIAEEVLAMTPEETQALIKERELEHLAEPGRIARILDEPETGGSLH